MRRNILTAALACAVLSLAGVRAGADDKKPLTGTWALKGGETKIEFVDKENLKVMPHGDANVIALVCSYTVDKNGVVKAKLTELQGKEEVREKAKGHLPVGLEFSFKWQVKNDTARLDDLKGDKVEPFKSHLEGDYEKK